MTTIITTTIENEVPAGAKTYSVPFGYMDALEEKFKAINKRAHRLKQTKIDIVVHGFSRQVDDESGEVSLFRIITVLGESPRVNGQTFIATIEHPGVNEDGEWLNLVRSVPGQAEEGQLDAYRMAEPNCQHCNTVRTRNNTYLLRNKAGEIKQVGHNCLRDYIGYDSPDTLAAMAEILYMAHEACDIAEDEDDDGHGGGKQYIDIESYLSYVSACIEKFGWVTKEKARIELIASTSEYACEKMDDRKKLPESGPITPTEQNTKHALDALAWIRGNDWNALNDWLFKIYVISKGIAVTRKHIGILACLMNEYDKFMQKQHELAVAQATSFHQGEKGEKIVRTMKCTRIIPVEGFRGGVSKLHLFVDSEGNAYKWFATSATLEAGQSYTLIGMVTEHDERDGVKQTQLSRCKEYVEKPARVSRKKATA